MQYTFTNIELANDANGNKFVKTTACRDSDASDRGFGLPFFNPEIIASVERCLANGEAPAFNFNAEIEEETVQLKQVYYRRATRVDESGKTTILDTPATNPKTGKPDPVRKLRVHTIFQYAMHDAFYVSGERKGMRIMEDGYDAQGRPCKVPAKAFDLDEFGRPIKLYMRGWTPEERRDNILATFFVLAPPEAQQTIQAAAPEQPVQQPQQTLNDVAGGLFQQPGNAAPQPGQQPVAQGGAAPQVDPLAQ